MILAGSVAKLLFLLVPEAGLEPAQGCPYRILSPARLPFHHSGTGVNIDNQRLAAIQERRQLEEKFPTLLERADAGEFGIFDIFQLHGVADRENAALEAELAGLLDPRFGLGDAANFTG